MENTIQSSRDQKWLILIANSKTSYSKEKNESSFCYGRSKFYVSVIWAAVFQKLMSKHSMWKALSLWPLIWTLNEILKPICIQHKMHHTDWPGRSGRSPPALKAHSTLFKKWFYLCSVFHTTVCQQCRRQGEHSLLEWFSERLTWGMLIKSVIAINMVGIGCTVLAQLYVQIVVWE